MASFLHTWLLFPAVLLVIFLGCGLVITRLAGAPSSRLLLLPLGFAGAVVVATALTWQDVTSELAAPALALLTVLGLFLGRAQLRGLAAVRRTAIWPALAFLIPALAIAAPVLPTGEPGFTGYGRIIDIGHQFDYTSHVLDNGQQVPAVIDSSQEEQVRKMVGVGYPGGAQVVHGAASQLVAFDLAWTYQPFLAVLAGLLSLTLFSLLRSIVASSPLRALAAGIAAQPTILYSLVLGAGIKEVAVAALLILLVTLLVQRPGLAGAWRALLPAGVTIAAAFATFSLAVVPWLGMLMAIFFVAELWASRGQRVKTVGRWAVLTLGAAVLTLPTLVNGTKLLSTASAGGPADLGNLAAPVSAWATAGPWLTGDHRFPLTSAGTQEITRWLAVGVLALAAVGLIRAVRQRDRGLLALCVAGLVAMLFVFRQSGPWVELKAIAINAPLVLAFAFAGIGGLMAYRRLRPVGVLLAVAVAGAVLAGNAFVYRDAVLAPYDRFAELEQIGEQFAGDGPALFPGFEEHAEYFLRDLDAVGLVNPPVSRRPQYSADAREGMQFSRWPDEIGGEYLQSFRLLVLRRDPLGARPPSNFRLVEQFEHHEVYRRAKSPETIVAHQSLEGTSDDRSPSFCTELTERLEEAGPAARLAYAPSADVVQITGSAEDAPPRWEPVEPDFFTRGPGRLSLTVEIPYGDEWNVWVRGSFGREVRVLIDGEEQGALRWKQNYPQQYEPIGSVELAAGAHEVEIVRGGGSLLPGTGNGLGGLASGPFVVGPVAFVPTEGVPEMETVPAAEAMERCRSDQRWDWVEIVRPAQALDRR